MMSLDKHVTPLRPASPVYVSVQEFAAHIGCSDDTVYKLIRSGQLPVIKLGTIYRIERDLALKSLNPNPPQ